MYKIFGDQHHLSLFNSLRLLFEKRLGGLLYRPIGKEWVEQGYWRMAELYNNSPETIEQYLGIRPDYIPADGSMKLNKVERIEDGVYYILDPEYDYYHRAITLEKFMQVDIDIVIASIPQHIASFARLCEAHPKKPKLIYQVGNSWTVNEGYAKNIMASAIIPNVPADTNIVTYHQEFDLDIFYPDRLRHANYPTLSKMPEKNIYSFVNCFNTAQHYKGDWLNFLEIEKQMPDWNFKSYGGSCRDGAANGARALADKIREARFVWQVKMGGDGYGHILHNTAACGRPMITRRWDYVGKLGERLLIDGVTCIGIEGLSIQEMKNKIEYYNEPVRYVKMCFDTYQNFKKVVDFDREEKDLTNFLNNLL